MKPHIGRPKLPKDRRRVNISLTLGPNAAKILSKASAQKGESKSQIVSDALITLYSQRINLDASSQKPA